MKRWTVDKVQLGRGCGHGLGKAGDVEKEV